MKKLFFYEQKTKGSQAFTLVEVVLALGVMGFGMVSIMGLLPVGLTAFRAAMDRTVSTQIVQAVVNEYQLTDFGNLPSAMQTFFYDDEGQSNDYKGQPVTATTAKYRAEVVVAASSLPGALAANPDLQRLEVKIIDQPSGRTLRTFSSLLVKRTK